MKALHFELKQRWGWIVLAALLVLLIGYARSAQQGKQQHGADTTQQAAVPVTTAAAAGERMPIVATAIGTVTPLQSVVVKARIDGELQKVAFAEGQSVKAGDLMAQIDPRPFQAQLAQLQAQKARDEAQLRNSIVDLERYTTLLQQDSIARQQVDTQRAAVDQLKATLKLDQAQIDNAAVQLSYTTIRAPFTGRTGVRLVDPGNIVHATDNTGMVTINQIDPISVLFTLPEDKFQGVTRAAAANRAEPLSVEAYARADGTLLGTGKLTLINNQIDTATGTFQLRAVFANAGNTLWPGQYVNLRVILRVLQDAVTIPESAVQRGPQGVYVYIVKPDSSVGVQSVRLTQTEAGKAIVDEGIAAGERIVVSGQLKLKPGSKVVEANTAAVTAAATPHSPAAARAP
jgi:multidrug efflux system membrane fusion protein